MYVMYVGLLLFHISSSSPRSSWLPGRVSGHGDQRDSGLGPTFGHSGHAQRVPSHCPAAGPWLPGPPDLSVPHKAHYRHHGLHHHHYHGSRGAGCGLYCRLADGGVGQWLRKHRGQPQLHAPIPSQTQGLPLPNGCPDQRRSRGTNRLDTCTHPGRK